MITERYLFEKLPQFSLFDIAYQNDNESLTPFYKYSKNKEAILDVIKNKNFNSEKREKLHDTLIEQYAKLNTTAVLKNIISLKSENTFTVTTAHQPVLFGGPLFFIYKICSTINLSIQLNNFYPEYHFVPVYWMGEDHDFEEVNHFFIFGKKISWDDYQGGLVSGYKCESLINAINELFDILGDSQNARDLKEIIQECFKSAFTYGEASFRFVNRLFSKYGLVVVLPENRDLKSSMIPIFEEELLKNSSFYLVNETVKKLKLAGFNNQAFARPINLFYSIPGKRQRIEKIGDFFHVLNTEIKFSENEIIEELNKYPERFSPNVILRPLYQETILPNVAFVGGGGEIAYWLERKLQFEHYKVPYPMILRRNSVMYIDSAIVDKMEKMGIGFDDILLDTNSLINKYISENKNFSISFENEKKEIENLYYSIAKKTKEIDQTIESIAIAQLHQAINSIEKLESRLLKTEKQRLENEINQLRRIQEKLYLPTDLQERKENFMSLYLKHGKEFFDFLVENLNPFHRNFTVIKDKNQ